MNIICILNNRKSVRNYLDEDINLEILDKVVLEGTNSKPLYNNIDVQFRLIEDGRRFAKKIRGYAGYFGKIFYAPHYIVAISENKKGFLENIGYRMEKLMIKAQELGLSTCWMEVLFDTEKINHELNLGKDYRALVLTPIGHEKKTIFNKFMQLENQKKSQRKDLKEVVVFDKWHNYRSPQTNLESNYLKIIEYARLAPSWGNRQPWKFLISNGNILVFCEKNKILVKKEKLNLYRIDCGIVMLYLKLLGEEFGIRGKWILDESNLCLDKHNIPDNYEYVGCFTVV